MIRRRAGVCIQIGVKMTAPELLESYFKKVAIGWAEEDGISKDGEEYDLIIEDFISEVKHETRSGDFETNITPPCLRNYEVKSVAKKLKHEDFDGYIGWNYYYGGGKHSNPEELEWVGEAYFLELVEQREIVTIERIFKKE